MARGGARRAGGVPKGGRKRNILRRVLPWATGCEDYCSRGPAPMTPGAGFVRPTRLPSIPGGRFGGLMGADGV